MSFDLHVLAMPPAFNLSQDQTLQLIFVDPTPPEGDTGSCQVKRPDLPRPCLLSRGYGAGPSRWEESLPGTMLTTAFIPRDSGDATMLIWLFKDLTETRQSRAPGADLARERQRHRVKFPATF